MRPAGRLVARRAVVRSGRAAGLGLAVLAAACTPTTNHTAKPNEQVAASVVTIAADSNAPAPEVPGAKPGGTITVLADDDLEHLDPARAYVSNAQLANQVIQRTLTTFRRTALGGLELVGDLATDTGRSSEGSRVWTFTLRDGLKFEDGTAITSKEIAYGVARSFSPALADGPTWLQQWLAGDANFNQKYRGPYDGGAPTPPGVETPDPKTIVFRFSRPQPDMPFAATLGNTTPVPPAKDTKTAYDNKPVASGPYRVETYQRGTRLVLARNPHWSAATDPVRHAYADRFVLTFGQNPVNATQRILAGNGADQAAISWEMVPPQTLPRITSNQAVESHATRGATAYVGYLKINMQRVTDLSVRRALNCAFDRDAYIKATGGQAVAEPATTLLAKVVSGHRQYDAYHCGASGDPAKARKMLGGRTVTLSYGFRNNERGQKVAATIQSSLRKAGFDLKLVPIESTDYYTTIRTKNNGLDIYMASWGADWPSGATVIPALADGRTIADRGNSNTSYFNDAAVNAEIDRISSITNLTKASLAWAALDEKIMRKYAPMVPVYYDRTYSLNGAKVGGLHMDDVLGGTSLIDAYVK